MTQGFVLTTKPRTHRDCVARAASILSVGLLFVFQLAALSSADVLCATSIGNVKLRVACRPTETQINPIALGLQGPKGDKGTKETRGRKVRPAHKV